MPIIDPLTSDQVHLPLQIFTTFSVHFSSVAGWPGIVIVTFPVQLPRCGASGAISATGMSVVALASCAAPGLPRLRVICMNWLSLPSGPVIQQVSTELSASLNTYWLLKSPAGVLPLNVQVFAFSSQAPVMSHAHSSSIDETQIPR